jgi:hypothetical protein
MITLPVAEIIVGDRHRHVLAALAKTRDTLSKWISTIEGWPVQPDNET